MNSFISIHNRVVHNPDFPARVLEHATTAPPLHQNNPPLAADNEVLDPYETILNNTREQMLRNIKFIQDHGAELKELGLVVVSQQSLQISNGLLKVDLDTLSYAQRALLYMVPVNDQNKAGLDAWKAGNKRRFDIRCNAKRLSKRSRAQASKRSAGNSDVERNSKKQRQNEGNKFYI